MGIVKTWGNVGETLDYLKYNGYKGIVHLFGEFYFCCKIGVNLGDVKRIVGVNR